MSQKYEKLKTLLKELFQLDQPDLDFGLYRIMHSKSAEVTQFLDKDLLPQVKEAFALYKTADKVEVEKELAKVTAGIEAAGMDPEQSPKVKELRARLKTDIVDTAALESEVYDHLFSFFRRYYSEGDFLAKRVYKAGTYAIPYEGEEVKLYWANQDQYYIKSSEYLRDYAFRLRPDDEQKPMRVHFRLADAAEGEHGNVKAAEGKERRFRLADDRAVSIEGGELVIRFIYQPNPSKQEDLNAAAESAILAVGDSAVAAWIAELKKPHMRADGTTGDSSRLRVHLDRYTARNTFDYFIHKDLGGFLRRELDFYIKNEVMHLDDVENETAPRVEQYLSKIKVIRKIAGKIIDFLAQLEDFQKKLWLKKKFVVETSYRITLDCISEEFYDAIAASAAQREEWVRLLCIDKIVGDLAEPGYSVPLTRKFLRHHRYLPVNTSLLREETANAIVASGATSRGAQRIAVHADNAAALRLLGPTMAGAAACTYIDPPYNTGDGDFAYKDAYQRSSWLAFMGERLQLGRELTQKNGSFLVSIDRNEMHRLVELGDQVFGPTNRIAEFVWERGRKNDAKYVSLTHEFFLLWSPSFEQLRAAVPEWRERKPGVDEVRAKFDQLCNRLGGKWDEIRSALWDWVSSKFDPAIARSIMLYDKMDQGGPFRDDTDLSWPGGGGPMFSIENPVTGDLVPPPRRGWMTNKNALLAKIASGELEFDPDNPKRLRQKRYFFEYSNQVKSSNLYRNSKAATRLVRDMLGDEAFSNPKDHDLLADLISYVSPPGGLVLDYFAGSGSTGHALWELERRSKDERPFVLVEVGSHFDGVLLPRLLRSAYSKDWDGGTPRERHLGLSYCLKVLRLESYEDALNNLETCRTGMQQRTLGEPRAQSSDSLREQYVLRYMLDVETRGSQSLLNVQGFADPTAYKLKVNRPGSDESRETNVDLQETFNWLIGLTVRHMGAPSSFAAAFERDGEGRLQLKGRLKEDPTGPFWFRVVTGTVPDGRKALIVWRKLTGQPEQDNLVLDAWFTKQGYSSKDSEFDLIYVNGGNNLENLRAPDQTWKVRLIEDDFHRLMFASEAV